jgi:hypothetical protein
MATWAENSYPPVLEGLGYRFAEGEDFAEPNGDNPEFMDFAPGNQVVAASAAGNSLGTAFIFFEYHHTPNWPNRSENGRRVYKCVPCMTSKKKKFKVSIRLKNTKCSQCDDSFPCTGCRTRYEKESEEDKARYCNQIPAKLQKIRKGVQEGSPFSRTIVRSKTITNESNLQLRVQAIEETKCVTLL